jgi:adenylyltransferase/sulfurtransferase
LALSLEENATVLDLFKLMIKDYPDLRDLSFDEFSNFRDYLSVAINNVDIQGLKGTNTPLKDGDTILVMPPIGGG